MSEVELHLGDCLDVLREMEPGSVSAVVTDPPYNVKFGYNNDSDNRADYAEWCALWLDELERLSTGAIAISCGIVNVPMWCDIRKPKWIACWHKPATMGRSPVGFNNWEPMLLYGSLKSATGCDVVKAVIIPDKSLDEHPCPKPLGWATGFIRLLSNPGDIILDPFLGSGTTAVAAILEGRNAIGIEIDPTYYAIAERRIAQAQAQPPLIPHEVAQPVQNGLLEDAVLP